MDTHPRLRASHLPLSLTVFAVLVMSALGIVAWRLSRKAGETERIVTMQARVDGLRNAIRRFRADTGRHPRSLDELVPRYLQRIPEDPITGSASTWRLTTEEIVTPSDDFTTSSVPRSDSVIIDVHSSAPGADANGKAWSSY